MTTSWRVLSSWSLAATSAAAAAAARLMTLSFEHREPDEIRLCDYCCARHLATDWLTDWLLVLTVIVMGPRLSIHEMLVNFCSSSDCSHFERPALPWSLRPLPDLAACLMGYHWPDHTAAQVSKRKEQEQTAEINERCKTAIRQRFCGTVDMWTLFIHQQLFVSFTLQAYTQS